MKFQPVQINCRGRLHVFRRPLVMGILNITPDSFYAGSRMADDSNLLRTAESMLKAGPMYWISVPKARAPVLKWLA